MWFEDLMGFKELNHENVHNNIGVDGEYLFSKVNNEKYKYGNLELVSLKDLRQKITAPKTNIIKITVAEKVGDVQMLHKDVRNENAVFQAASQFNLLEMVDPSVSPESGVANYQLDRTQGPACAIACGAGTIYRNYFVDVKGLKGQTRNNQIDGLEDIGKILKNKELDLWKMQNGYAFPSSEGIAYINNHLSSLSDVAYDILLSNLKVGVQWNTEVTISNTRHTVNQVYCSALPVAYSQLEDDLFEPFAQLVLDATYEATILTAIQNLETSGNNKLFLTLVGGGVFGNKLSWIFSAIRKAVMRYKYFPLDIQIVSFGGSNLYVETFCDSIDKEVNNKPSST